MNLARIKAALEARYQSNPEDRRVLRLLRKVRRTLDKRTRARTKAEPGRATNLNHQAHSLLLRLDNAFSSGKRIVAIDAEWSRDGSRPITELGFTTYQNGVLTRRNIRILPDDKKGRDMFFDVTEYMTDEEALSLLQETVNEADFIAGHALRNDRIQLKRWRGYDLHQKNVFDTQVYAQMMVGKVMNLSDLLYSLDINPARMHCAGNDAFFVMMAMLMLVDRTDEVRQFGGHPADPEKYARLVRSRARIKANRKAEDMQKISEADRARKKRSSIAISEICVGKTYLGRDQEDYPRTVLRMEERDEPRAPSGKVIEVYFRKKNGKEKKLSLVNFSHWAIEEANG